MSDFSLFSLFAAGLACLVPFTNAYTQPTGDAPEGNPIYTPGLNDVVPVNQEYGITWQPTTEGTVTLVLLKGPANNLEVLYPLVEKIANNGNFFWTPSDKLEPGETGYGIQLIDDETGQYQYTTQFGISNPDWTGPASSASPSGYPTSTASESASPSGYAHPTGWSSSSAGGYAHPTGSWAHANGTQPIPTGHYTKPKPTWHTTKAATTVAPTTSYAAPPTNTPPPPEATGAASNVATSFFGLVAAAGIAVFAL